MPQNAQYRVLIPQIKKYEKKMKSAVSKKRIPAAVIMLGMVSLFTDAATEMIYPLIPVFVGLLGSGAVVLGIIEGVAETTAAMLKLIVGVWSDKIKKRKLFVLFGYTLSSLVRPFTGLVTGAAEIIFIRMIDRVGKGIRSAPRDALIADSVDDSIRGKAYGFHRGMDHSGAIIGPLLAIIVLSCLFTIGGITSPLKALRWTFILAIVPGLLAVITIVFFIKEKTEAKMQSKAFTFSLKQFDREFIKYLGVVILFTLGNSSDAFLLFRVQEELTNSAMVLTLVEHIAPLKGVLSHFPDPKTQTLVLNVLFIPLIWAYFHLIKVFFSMPMGALSDKIGRKVIINIGWGIYALVYFCFALLDKLPALYQLAAVFVLFAVYALFYACTEGTEKALVADMVSPETRGSAFGMYNFSIGLGALPASIIFGLLYSMFGGFWAFSFGAALALLAMILLLFVKIPKK